MKMRVLAALLAAVLMLGLLTGCSSADKTVEKIESIAADERSEKEWIKLMEAYWKLGKAEKARDTLWKAEEYCDLENLSTYDEMYLLPAPEVDEAPGSYTGAVELRFSGNQYSHGKLYVTVNVDASLEYLEEDDSVSDDGIYIYEYPKDGDFLVTLYEPGDHVVRAFVAYDGYGFDVQSHVFEGTYSVSGADFSAFAFSKAEGTYPNPTEVSFQGVDGGKVYYTLDGKDPLTVHSGFASLAENGTELTSGGIPFHIGKNNVKARMITANGLISPLLKGSYKITTVFASASLLVAENSVVDFVGCKDGLKTFPKAGGTVETIFNKPVQAFSAFVLDTQMKDAYPKDTVDNAVAMSGEMALQLQQIVEVTQLYLLPTSGMSISAIYAGTRKTNEYERTNRIIPTFLGNYSWERYNGKISITRVGNKNCVGTEAVAQKASMMTEQLAVWTDNSYNNVDRKRVYDSKVYACNPDGSNERVLFTSQGENAVVLDAMTDKVLLYHVGDKHMIFNLVTGEQKENTKVPATGTFLGYSSTALYMYDSHIKQYPMDYNAL